MMVVMVIIGLLMALVGPRFIRQEEKAKSKAAKAQIELLGTALDTFRLDVGRYPTTQEGRRRWSSGPSGSTAGTGRISRRTSRSIRGTGPTTTAARARTAAPTTSTPSGPMARPAARATTPTS